MKRFHASPLVILLKYGWRGGDIKNLANFLPPHPLDFGFLWRRNLVFTPLILTLWIFIFKCTLTAFTSATGIFNLIKEKVFLVSWFFLIVCYNGTQKVHENMINRATLLHSHACHLKLFSQRPSGEGRQPEKEACLVRKHVRGATLLGIFS